MADKSGTKKMVGLSLAILLPIIALLIFRPSKDNPPPRVELPPKYFPIGVDSSKNPSGNVWYDTLYQEIPNWRYATHLGDTMERSDLDGKVYVAEFFFATCPGICPLMNGQLMRVQKEFKTDEHVAIVSFSIDDNDSIPMLRDYAELHGAKPGKWYFLRGPEKDVQQLAVESFHVPAAPADMGGFDHSNKLILVDNKGVIRGYYDGTDSAKVNELIADIILILDDQKL